MNTYCVSVRSMYSDSHYDLTVVAKSSGAAKYQAFLDDVYDGITFGTFVGKLVRGVRCINKFKPSDLFGDAERFRVMCEHRLIPFARQGMRVKVTGKMGTIIGSNSSGNLDVCFDGQFAASNCHPWWDITYYDDNGGIIRTYGGSNI